MAGKKKSGKKKNKATAGSAVFSLSLEASPGFNAESGAERADVSELLSWFAHGAAAEPQAKLAFTGGLGKEDRAYIHKLVGDTFTSSLETASEGIEQERTITVYAKGRAPRKQPSAEEMEKVAMLYTLTRDDAALSKLSRDEIAEMVMSGSMKEELQSLWLSKQGEYSAGTRLLAALMTGDAAATQAAIEAAGDVIRRGVPILGTGELPLCRAARSGNVGALRALLAAGAPVDAKDSNGRTALQVSRTFEQCDAEAVLLQHGAHDPDAKLFPLSAAAAELKSATPAAAAPTAPAPVAAPPAASSSSSAAAAPATPVSSPQPKTKDPASTPSKPIAAPSSGAAAAVSDAVLHPSSHLLHPSSRTEEAAEAPEKVEAKASEAVSVAAKETAITINLEPIAKGSSSAEATVAAATACAPPVAAPLDVPGWSTVSAAMAWAQVPSNAMAVVAGASCVMALAAAFLMGGARKLRR